MTTLQKVFNPIDFDFKWTEDGTEYGWYEWNRKSAHSKALKARNAEAKRLVKEGYTVTTFSLCDQLVRRGGIGSQHPDIEHYVNCYGLDAHK